MATRMGNMRKAFKLFDQGKVPSSTEVKALGLKTSTRANYYRKWKIARGMPTEGMNIPTEGMSDGPSAKAKAVNEAEMVVPAPEKIEPKIEPPAEEKQPIDSGTKTEETTEPEQPEIYDPEAELDEEPEDSNEKASPKAKTGGNGAKPRPMIPGQGLTFAITISTKTLMLYQIAAAQQTEPLTMGDFIDACVEDTYRGRGLDLGLVKIGG